LKKKYEDYEIICPLPFGLYNLKEKLKDKLFKEYKYTFDFLNSKQNSYKNYAKFNRMIEKYMANQSLSVTAGSNFINMVKQNAYETYKNSEISTQLTGSTGDYDVALMNLIIPKNSKNKELAFEFAILLTNKENQLNLAKTTNVLPANKFALENEYFKICKEDLIDKSRCESAKQLNNLSNVLFEEENKKTINEYINKTMEEILLNEKSNLKFIQEKIEKLSKALSSLITN